MNKKLENWFFPVLLVLLFSQSLFAALSPKFSDLAWKRIEPLYQEILKHPFNQELALGTLPKRKFEGYQRQDAFYLVAYARALASLASQLESVSEIDSVLNLAKDSLKELSANRARAKNEDVGKPNRATQGYIDFLQAHAELKNPSDLSAALLPCFWIYLRLAEDLKKIAKPNSIYRDWLEAYSSPSYRNSVGLFLDVNETLFRRSTLEQRSKMVDAFAEASEHEKRFWDSAYTE